MTETRPPLLLSAVLAAALVPSMEAGANGPAEGAVQFRRPKTLKDAASLRERFQKQQALHKPRPPRHLRRTGLRRPVTGQVVEIADDVLIARPWTGPGPISDLRRLGYRELRDAERPVHKSFRGTTVYVRYPLNRSFPAIKAGQTIELVLARDDYGYLRVNQMRAKP